jgi:polar amino acid transport system substrate-binding protein
MKWVFIIFVGLFHINSAQSEDLYLQSDFWCPYTCDPKDQNHQGYIIDIAREVFEQKGITVHYAIVPWARSLVMTQHNSQFASPGSAQDEGEGLIIPEVKIGVSENSYIVKKIRNLDIQSIEDLTDKRLGVVKGYQYWPELDDYINSAVSGVHLLHGSDPLEKGLRMLESDHLDVIVDDSNVVRSTAKRLNFQDDIKFISPNQKGVDLYISFSPKDGVGEKYAKILSDGILNLRKSGQLQNILAKYNLKDWVDKS